jgi:tetratricopeptide (TPR) repeat protein
MSHATGTPLDEPTRQFGETFTAAGELAPGSRIGAWRVLRVIGRGGMGEVYLAERADLSFDKQVALKLVQGMMTPAARLRFDAEKQALARLEHPHIARLIDAGETGHGWPYLVMEYVDGMPIDHYLSDRGVHEVLATFLQVCDAAAYAHRQLVLHRDIKPSNILVDGEGKAKLLDFGIAKLLQSTEGPEISHTVERAYTPEYASPEQVFGRPIGVASDIYSLGVLLYRLLTGVPPYTFEPGDTVGLVRSLSEDTVVAPSRAILGETVQFGGARRRRSRLLAGDLDTIVRTALKKQPERRYASVDAFAEDIRRHLANEPIRARPDSLGYRAQKFLRRNAIAVAATVAVLLALVGGLVASVWQAQIAEHQRQRAEQRFEDVRGLAHAMLYDLNDELAKLPGSTNARKTLVHEALAYLQKLSAEDQKSLPLRREIASAWLRVGDVQGAPGMPNLDDLQGALKSYARASAYVESILHEAPADRDARVMQAQILLHRADALFDTYALVDAGSDYRRDAELWTRLRAQGVPEAGPGLAKAQLGLGNVAFWNDKQQEALHHLTLAQATIEAAGPVDGQLAYGLLHTQTEVRRGEILDWIGRAEEARAAIRQALGQLQALQRTYPDQPNVRHAVAMTWMKLAEDSYDLKDKTPVLQACENARAILATEAAVDPADMRAKRLLALADQEIGDSLVDLKRYDEALARYQSALQGEQDVAAHEPRDESVRQDLGNTWYGIAGLYQERNQRELAVAAFRQTVAVRQALVTHSPHAAALRRDLAQALGNLAAVLSDPKDACSQWIASDFYWQAIAKAGGAAPTDLDDIAKAHKSALACH